MTDNTINRSTLSAASAIQLWTVVTLVGERMSCTIHPSEDHAYREAVARVEYAEPNRTRRNRRLRVLLNTAASSGDYRMVREYIKRHSQKIHLMQLAKHELGAVCTR
jgi:hypothetical protein